MAWRIAAGPSKRSTTFRDVSVRRLFAIAAVSRFPTDSRSLSVCHDPGFAGELMRPGKHTTESKIGGPERLCPQMFQNSGRNEKSHGACAPCPPRHIVQNKIACLYHEEKTRYRSFYSWIFDFRADTRLNKKTGVLFAVAFVEPPRRSVRRCAASSRPNMNCEPWRTVMANR